MIIRIVHMFFEEEKTKDFLSVFESSANQIRNFEGCKGLQLWKNADVPGGYTTYSFWENQSALENYRKSELFLSTWKNTKILFRDKPIAFSFEKTKFDLT